METLASFEPVTFRDKAWLKQPYPFRETAVDRNIELLSFESVGRLIDKMEPNDLIYRKADGAVSSNMQRLPFENSLVTDLEATLSRTTNSLMLQAVDRYDPAYAELVTKYLQTIAAVLEIDFSSMRNPSASIFRSSPNAVSPFHTDREQNFLVHLHGVKTMCVVPRPWRSTLGEIGEALFRPRKGIAPEFNGEYEQCAQQNKLEPGASIYIPRIMPHWVTNGPQVSMSLSINFFCIQDFLMERFFDANDKLRALFTSLSSPEKKI